MLLHWFLPSFNGAYNLAAGFQSGVSGVYWYGNPIKETSGHGVEAAINTGNRVNGVSTRRRLGRVGDLRKDDLGLFLYGGAARCGGNGNHGGRE
jgi:hypothetical protein